MTKTAEQGGQGEKMAIFGIGATFSNNRDVSERFIQSNVAGSYYDIETAPDIHQFIRSMKVGDIVFLKKAYPAGSPITVKAIGIITDDTILNGASTNNLMEIGRNVRWLNTEEFVIPCPEGKNNVRVNALYEEFHPEVQRQILERIGRAN